MPDLIEKMNNKKKKKIPIYNMKKPKYEEKFYEFNENVMIDTNII